MTTTLELPHWETTPPDLKAAIRETKAAIRARIEASGRTVEEVFAVAEARVAERVADIEDVVGVSVQPAVAIGVIGSEIGAASADVVEQNNAVIRLECGGDEAPHVLVAAEPMREHHRLGAGTGESHVIASENVVDHRLRWRLY